MTDENTLCIRINDTPWILYKQPPSSTDTDDDWVLVWKSKDGSLTVELHHPPPVQDWWKIEWSCLGIKASSELGGGQDATLKLAIKSFEQNIWPLRRMLGG